jgi:hypothetical protein
MTKRKPRVAADEPELHPDLFYRKHHPFTLGVIGIGVTQIDEAIERGELPPLVSATESGRAVGWIGRQLIELQKRRLEKDEADAAKRNAT